MIGLKRFIRPGFVVSLTGHLGVLVLGLAVVAASSSQSKPPEAALTDAMLVDVVPPNEVPRLEGTPADATTSGSEAPVNSNIPSVAAQPPPPKPASQPRQQPQPRSNPQRDARQTMALPLAAQSETARPQKTQSETPPPEAAAPETANMASEPPPSPPQPHFEEDQPGASETLARLALLGGQLGGGFEAPAINSPNIAHDFTVAFRERVSSCSTLPPGLRTGDRIAVALRISFNQDGTLASTPQAIEPIASQKEEALMQSAISALQRCQPYTMLPAEKYKQWKTLSLVFAPFNFPGR